MHDIHSNHPERVARLCKHGLHLSASTHTPWCPRCIITAAQADLGRAWKRLKAEGGPDASAYMRDRAWNVARLQYAATKRRVENTMRRDWQRQERERLWEEAHRWYLAQHGHIPSDLGTYSPCTVCATMKRQSQRYAKPVMSLTTAWWEREGALVGEEIIVPETPPRSLAKKPRRPQARARQPSCLGDLIQSWRSTNAVSAEQKRIWEGRCKLDRAIRRKYALHDDYELDQEIFAYPLPASHARHHYRQIQNGEHAAERRANRHKRRAEDYRPCRSSLALSELARDVEVDEAELERLRAEAEFAESLRLARRVPSEVGYLYFVGEMGLLEKWRDEFESSDLDLIERQREIGVYVRHVDEECVRHTDEEHVVEAEVEEL